MPRNKANQIDELPNSPRPSRAGSHAGRGFRYQDAAAAWLAIKCWAGDFEFGSVVPEGGDDAELHGVAGYAFVQIKSRRDELGPHPRSDVARFVRQLWLRADVAKRPPDQLILLLERAVEGLDLAPEMFGITFTAKLDVLIENHSLASRWRGRTRLVIAPNPMESAIAMLEQKLGCTPLVAAVYFAAVADTVGKLSDDNGMRSPEDFLSLSLSDIERLIDSMAGVLDANILASALQKGECEPVDFLTPLDDPNFYLGVDVQPGHLAAGLVFERPKDRVAVLEALERRRAVLITGPSGAGKSGLMWESARATRHMVRWFRVKARLVESVTDLMRLADSFRATVSSPIGFVFDDVGRHRTELWDALSVEAAVRGDVVLLGSLREEDMFLVTRRGHGVEVRVPPDAEFAERIWSELRARGETQWPGWREPWAQCEGLLLEYVHLLTQQRHLVDVLREQVDRRVREKRVVELSVLRVTSVVGQTGATVDLKRLQEALHLTDAELSLALTRLIDEHLVQELSTAQRLGSLHQIRAAALSQLTHERSPPLKSDTLLIAVSCIVEEEIESFVARTLTDEPHASEQIVAGAAKRVIESGDLALLAAVLRAFDASSIGVTIDRWLPHLSRLGIAPTQATLLALLSVTNSKPILPAAAPNEAVRLLAECTHQDQRSLLLDEIANQLPELLACRRDWGEVREVLAAYLGTPLHHAFEQALDALKPDLLRIPLHEAIELLEAANAAVQTVALAWVEQSEAPELLTRLTRETPWISHVHIREEPEGLAVCANVFHISDRLQPDLHGDVVALCRAMLALAPTAALAVANAIEIDGNPTLSGEFPVATKRIPRAALPAAAVPARVNRWIAAVAQRVSPAGSSHYLSEARRLLHLLVPALETLVEGILRGKDVSGQIAELGRVHEASLELTQPQDPKKLLLGEQLAIGVSALQHVINYCSANLIRGLLALPDNATASFANATDVIAQIDKVCAEEPWGLIGDAPPPSLHRLRTLVSQIRLIFGEAGSKKLQLRQLFPGVVKSSLPGKRRQNLSGTISRQIGDRLRELDIKLQQSAREIGFVVNASSRAVTDYGGPWPYAETLVVVELAHVDEIVSIAESLAAPLRHLGGVGRMMHLVPAFAKSAVVELAVSGVDKFFPAKFNDPEWLATAGFGSTNLPRSGRFALLLEVMLEASSIQTFGCATEGRALEEAKAFERSVGTIDSTRMELVQLGPAEQMQALLRELDHFVEDASHDPQEQQDRDTGESSTDPAIVSRLQLALIRLDLEALTPSQRM